MSHSGGEGDDLEDGEIFDEDDEIPPPAPAPPPPPTISIGSFVDELKKKASPPLRKLPLTHLRQQRRQKRLREDDRTFKNNKQRRRSSDEKSREKGSVEDEDTRDISPLRGDWGDRVHQRPAFGDDLDEDDDDLMEGGRRGGGGGGRGMLGNRRRGGGGRNVRGGRRGTNRREGGQICRFYLQGKCQRGNDCPYSHAIHQRKYELCKFYMMDCCAKKDRCPYLHSEFPCKYFHLGMKCYAGKKCKFSHGKISPQFRAQLLRDSKEHLASSPKEDDDVRRERRERIRERKREREHRDKERRKGREKKEPKEDHDKFTLHFKVDPRTISDEEEGQKTPMPSPNQDNSTVDRKLNFPEAAKIKSEFSPETDAQVPDPKDSGFGEELPDFIPADLPKHQRELYKRIHQQQREASNAQDDEELGEKMEKDKEEEDFKDEDWYSSEEEDRSKKLEPLTALLNKLKQQPSHDSNPPETPTPPPPPIISSVILPDIDINAVSKLLSSVRETIQQKQNIENLNRAAQVARSSQPAPVPPPPELDPLPPLNALIADAKPSVEKRRVRDPRLRGNSSEDDIDLRRQDVDLRQLPFKPAPIQPPANEIDASINTHPPLHFQLIPFSPPPPPDYSNVHPKNSNDPRLRRYLPGGGGYLSSPLLVSAGVTLPISRPALASRDPRQVKLLPNDPRRRRDSDLRLAFNNVSDIDLRQQSTHLAFK